MAVAMTLRSCRSARTPCALFAVRTSARGCELSRTSEQGPRCNRQRAAGAVELPALAALSFLLAGTRACRRQSSWQRTSPTGYIGRHAAQRASACCLRAASLAALQLSCFSHCARFEWLALAGCNPAHCCVQLGDRGSINFACFGARPGSRRGVDHSAAWRGHLPACGS